MSTLPERPDYLAHVRATESRIENEVEAALYQGLLGTRGGGLYGAIAGGLDLWSGVVGCRWRCSGGTHSFQKLHRRAINAEYAALRLAWGGYYDEAIAVVRVGAEILNLAQLFADDSNHQLRWIGATEAERRRNYAPAAVRRLLSQSGIKSFYDAQAYGALCEGGVHLTPDAAERTHDLEADRFFVGPFPAIPALLLVLNEVGYAVSCALSLPDVIAELPDAEREAADLLQEALQAAIGPGELRMQHYPETVALFLTLIPPEAQP